MTCRQRVQAAFDKQATDKVPIHHIGFCSEVASGVLGREAYVGGGIQRWREAVALWQSEAAHAEFLERSFRDAIDVALLCEHDIVRASYWRYNVKPTQRIDEYTFLYEYGEEEDWQVLRYDPGSEQCHIFPYLGERKPTFEELDEQLTEQERSVEDYQPSAEDSFEIRAQQLLGEERVIRVGAGGVGIPHEAIWLEAMLLRPDLVARLLDIAVERTRRDVAFLTNHGFRYIFGGGDFASNTGPMYSPQIFHDLVAPRMQQIADICHQYGAYYLFASDGNLWPVAEDLFGKSGIDGYFEIDRRAGMDLGLMRERFPELTLIGNISSHTVHLGSREEVIAETRSCLQEAKRSGGIIVGTSNYFVPGTPRENVEAMLETIREQR